MHAAICRYMFADCNITMTSIEPDASASMYGSLHRHIEDTAQNLMKHVQPEAFNVAVLNGVIGFGLNKGTDIRVAAAALYSALKPNALLIIGYNWGISHGCYQFD